MDAEKKTLYPNYDVMSLQEEWDAHTREVVKKRLGPFQFTLLSPWEQEMLKVIAGHMAYEERGEILEWVAFHVDDSLVKPYGEAQRQPGTPPQKLLIRNGLKALDLWAKKRYAKVFLELEGKEQLAILCSLQQGHLEEIKSWDSSLQKELFKKLLGLVVEAYYSHPVIWSEIGYGGPAYPRGYVRVELGLLDPWEPRREGTTDET